MNKCNKARLAEIYQEMHSLLDEAGRMIRQEDKILYERSKPTWIGNIDAAIGGGDFPDNGNTFLKTLHELDIDENEDNEDDNPDDEEPESEDEPDEKASDSK